jgi:glycosyltransferase involved in cell wall biosynthesis
MQIVIVVVLYKRTLDQSQTINSLAQVFARSPELLESFKVLLWDNSPQALVDPALPFPFEYRHGARNLGTSGAYNHAMEFAESLGAPWLLLFDQDTTVSQEYLPRMLEYSHRFQDDPQIGTVVPFVHSHGTLVSPRSLLSFNRVKQIPSTFHGVYKRKGYAVNSATLMRVAALREAGGYSEDFWLDLSDVYAFQAMYRKGRYMFIAGDLHLQHSIAALDFDKEMTPQRYRNFLAAESAYVDLYSSPLEQTCHLARLLLRTVRQYQRYHNKVFARICWEYFCRRLFHTKAKRILGWRKQLAQRDIPIIEDGQVIG